MELNKRWTIIKKDDGRSIYIYHRVDTFEDLREDIDFSHNNLELFHRWNTYSVRDLIKENDKMYVLTKIVPRKGTDTNIFAKMLIRNGLHDIEDKNIEIR